MSRHSGRTFAILGACAGLLVPALIFARGNPGKGGGSGGRPPKTESVGNNLSTPAIFTEGIGVTGLAAPAEPTPGLEPYQETWTGLRIPANGNPTLPAQGAEGTYCDGTTLPDSTCDGTVYYLQGIAQASWQASYQNGAGHAAYAANVKWGDNLFGSAWTATSTIHLEVSMRGATPLLATDYQSYFPTKSLYGSGSTETFGSTGLETPVADADNMVPALYSEVAYLTIQAIDGPGGTPVGSAIHVLATWNRAVEGPSTGALTPEVNASGNIVYSYNWFTNRDRVAAGWYRLTFGVMNAATTLPGIASAAPVAGNASIQGVFTPATVEGAAPTLNACGNPIPFMSGPEPQTLTNMVGCSISANTSTLDLQLTSGSTGGGGKGSGGGGGGGSGGGGGGSGGGGGHGGSGGY